MLLYWLAFATLGVGAAVLGIRYMMIEAGMVAALIKRDPAFQPKYAYSLDPADRTYNVREYRRRFPDGELTPKLRHTLWGLAGWFALALVWLFVVRPQP
jgi:hypothetical protein